MPPLDYFTIYILCMYGHMGIWDMVILYLWSKLFSDTPIRRGRRILIYIYIYIYIQEPSEGCFSDVIRYTIYDIRYTLYEIRNTIYDIRYTKYVIRSTKYVIRNTLYEIRYTLYAIRYTKYDIRNTIFFFYI